MSSWVIQLAVYIDLVVYCSMLIPLGMAWRRRAYLTGGLRVLATLPAFLFLSYWLTRLGIYLWRNNIPIIHLNTCIESVIYILVYYSNTKATGQRRIIRWLLAIFVCFALVDSFLLEGFAQINSYTNLLESILVTTLILVYFEEAIFSQHTTTRLLQSPLFVASIGIMLYLAGTVMLFLFTNHFITTNDELLIRQIYMVSSALIFILSLLLTRAFYLVRPRPIVAVARR